MFDIGVLELLVLAALVLIVLGPARLPEVARTAGLWLGRLRRTYNNMKLEIEREVGMDEVRRQLHNEQIMAEVKAVERDARALKEESITIDPGTSSSSSSSSPQSPPARATSEESSDTSGRIKVE